jgi:hypothetical protein
MKWARRSAAPQARQQAPGSLLIARIGGHPATLFGEASALWAREERADSVDDGHSNHYPITRGITQPVGRHGEKFHPWPVCRSGYSPVTIARSGRPRAELWSVVAESGRWAPSVGVPVWPTAARPHRQEVEEV